MRRIGVTLCDSAVMALELAKKRDGMTQTDVINRALQLYSFVLAETEKGNELWLAAGGKPTGRVHLL